MTRPALTLALAVSAIAVVWWRSGAAIQPIAPPASMRMTADEGFTADPAISPDGTLLAYASDREGSLNIWVQQVAGGSRPCD